MATHVIKYSVMPLHRVPAQSASDWAVTGKVLIGVRIGSRNLGTSASSLFPRPLRMLLGTPNTSKPRVAPRALVSVDQGLDRVTLAMVIELVNT